MLLLLCALWHVLLDEPPKFSGVLVLYLGPLIDEGAVPLQEVYALRGVRRDVVVLILKLYIKSHSFSKYFKINQNTLVSLTFQCQIFKFLS